MFFVGCIGPLDFLYPTQRTLRNHLVQSFGQLAALWLPTNDWVAPSSYRAEIGSSLTTIIFLFRMQLPLRALPSCKNETLLLEDHFQRFGRRRFNLNPGVLSQDGLFLVSHKPGPHRTELARHAWLEQQLIWEKGDLRSLPNAFGEYADPSRRTLFRNAWRRSHQSERRRMLNITGVESPLLRDRNAVRTACSESVAGDICSAKGHSRFDSAASANFKKSDWEYADEPPQIATPSLPASCSR